MQDRPRGVTDDLLRAALAAGWGIDEPVTYRPVGAGSYHWTAGPWFVTADRADRADLLARALRTAAALAGLPFVVAPVPARDGAVLRPLGPDHVVAVYPLIDGVTGAFGWHEDPDPVADLLIELHAVTPPDGTPRTGLGLTGDLRAALADRDRPWTGGPYSEPARALINEYADRITGWVTDFERLADGLRATDWVVTHGEPHPGNVLRTPGGELRLIDWDTVRIGPPERDLWMLTPGQLLPDPGDEKVLARYRAATGRPVSLGGLEYYRLSWRLTDVGEYAAALRRPHDRGGDADDALGQLRSYLTTGVA